MEQSNTISSSASEAITTATVITHTEQTATNSSATNSVSIPSNTAFTWVNINIKRKELNNFKIKLANKILENSILY